MLHLEPVRPHPLAHAFLGSFGELGRVADASVSLLEMDAWLLNPDNAVSDPGRRQVYRTLWRAIDSETAAVSRESIRKASGKG